MHGTRRPGPRNGCLGTTARQVSEPKYDHHAALDSRHYGAIRLANRDSTGTCCGSVGTLHASATLRMGRGISGNLESAWPDCDRTRGRPSHMDSCFSYSPDSRQGQSGLTPSFLMMRGPYQFTRNPMYVAELGLWLGWAIFFGNPSVLIGLLVLWSVVTFIILPREERSLEEAFGQTYLQYKSRVPRWF